MIPHKLLNPIYTALDHQQYNRAIKLCLQLQPTHDNNILVQALLAHAYSKTSEHRPKALQVLANILLTHSPSQSTFVEYFAELRLENQYAQTGSNTQTSTAVATTGDTTTTTTAPSPAPSRKAGKKGKKKPTAAAASAPSPTKTATTADAADAASTPDWDWIDALDTPPGLPENFDAIPTWPVPEALADSSVLSTLQITLSHLRLHLTAYQLYSWWASTLTASVNNMVFPTHDVVQHLRETFCLGLAVWMAPQYQHLPVRQRLLPAMQVQALQIARLETDSGMAFSTATIWAAQTALWQCHTSEDEPEQVEANKMAFLPRLAENLAVKTVQQVADETNRLTTEGFLLWLQSFELQNKWQEYLDAVNERLEQSTAADKNAVAVMGLSPAMLLDWKSNALAKLERTEEARAVAEESLRAQNSDQWDMWLRHIEYDNTTDYGATSKLAKELTIDTSEANSKRYPLRGPPLAMLEVLCRQIQKSDSKESLLEQLLTQIQSYGDTFGSRTSCTFADLSVSLECIFNHGDAAKATALLPWLYKMRQRPSAEKPSERGAELRAFIFAHQMTLKLLHRFPELKKDWLPDWKELVRAWKEFQTFEDEFKAAQTEEERKNAQKESRPADDVILLAIQLLLAEGSTTQRLVMAASLLEKAIEQSPDNAYLKLSSIFVHADLNATGRSWDLFRELFIKHIQHESCAYLILPLLRASGMYHEVIKVCQEIVRLQITALRDANDYTGKALDNGTLSKAEEFIVFQRERMNKSLTTLEAKGLIMDCAPLFKQDDRQASIGSIHGVVGGEDDLARVHKMISEAHNPQATFSLLRLKGTISDNLPKISENRDLNALAYEVFHFRDFPTSEDIVRNCLRRCHHHNLLLRTALCVEAMKGPKKGKVVKSSQELSKRCRSLVSRINQAQSFAESELSSPPGYGTVLMAMTKLCRAIAVLSGGFLTDEPASGDSLSFREDQMEKFLQDAVELLENSREQLGLSKSASITGAAIPDFAVPILALINMCAKANEMYGWGKKRRSIRKCAGRLYDFTQTFRSVLGDMNESLEEIELNSEGFSLDDELKDGIVPDTLSDDDVGYSLFVIKGAQSQTKLRLGKIIESIRTDLESFDTEE